MRLVRAAVVLMALAGTAAPAERNPEVALAADADFFPMTKGTYWVYRGRVAWAAEEAATVEWRSEILESAERGRFKMALLLGHPWDLPTYAPGRERDCYLLIADGNKKFYLHQPEDGCSIPEGEPGEDMISDDDESLILVMPAHEGDLFGRDAETAPRTDGMYAWSVERIEKASLAGIKGVAADVPRTEYVVAYRTLPDHQVATYVPGIGLTSFVCVHHGTVSDVNVKLVEFHVGTTTPPGQEPAHR